MNPVTTQITLAIRDESRYNPDGLQLFYLKHKNLFHNLKGIRDYYEVVTG